MPNSRLASLGGYGVVLDVPNNPYASAAENYINSFVNDSTKLYGGVDKRGLEVVGVIRQNIEKNEKIIEQQKAVYKAIQKCLPQGKTMNDLLTERFMQHKAARGSVVKLYDKASKKNIQVSSEQLAQARKSVERRTNIFHKNFQKANDLMLKAVANYQNETLEETQAKIEQARKQASNLVTQGFIEAYQNMAKDEEYINSVIEELENVQATLTGKKDAIQVEFINDEEIKITGIEGTQKAQLENQIKRLASLIRDLKKNGGYKSKRNKSGSANIKNLRYAGGNINYTGSNGEVDENKKRLYEIQQLINKEIMETLLSFYPKLTDRKRRQASRIATEIAEKVQVAVEGGQAKTISLPTPYYGTRESSEGVCLEYVASNPEWVLSEAPGTLADKLLKDGDFITSVKFTHTGKDKSRQILTNPGEKMKKNELTEKVSDMGALLRSIEENAQGLENAANSAATAMKEGRIDSIIDLAGTEYYIAFSDKFYNPKSISDVAVSGGSLYSNLTSLDSGFIPGTKINNKVLYLLLLNLANVAWYYQHDSDNTREKVKQTIQNLIMQNFFAMSFGPENLMSAYGIDKTNVLYVHNITGSIIPAYTTLETINRYLEMFMEGNGSQLSNRSPIKVSIDYSNQRTGMDLWQESLQKYPAEKGDPNKDARWQYVASWVAQDTGMKITFDLFAFDALYKGFYS